MDWWNLMKQSITVGAQLLWSSRYGCNNGRYGCTIVMSYIEINKAVSQWLLTFNLCVSVTWPLTCAFHIPCTHTPEIIDMHRGMCDNARTVGSWMPNGLVTQWLTVVILYIMLQTTFSNAFSWMIEHLYFIISWQKQTRNSKRNDINVHH